MRTQRLALRRNLLRPQSLTSLHDSTAAWLGLGSALGVMRRQTVLISHPTTIVALYLLCILGLHSTFPALLILVPRDDFIQRATDLVVMAPPDQYVSLT
jgi:hypothetical protein